MNVESIHVCLLRPGVSSGTRSTGTAVSDGSEGCKLVS